MSEPSYKYVEIIAIRIDILEEGTPHDHISKFGRNTSTAFKGK